MNNLRFSVLAVLFFMFCNSSGNASADDDDYKEAEVVPGFSTLITILTVGLLGVSRRK